MTCLLTAARATRWWGAVFLLVLCTAIPALAADAGNGHASTPAEVAAQLKEANERFTFRGEPIAPLALEDLQAWISDSDPGPVAAIELQGGYHSNRYYGAVVEDKDGWIGVTGNDAATKEKTYFAYRRLGRLANGCHVLETRQNFGGTGVFMSLLLVEFQSDFEYAPNGRRRARLLMMRRLELVVGDRFDGPIKVAPHEIRIGPGRIANDLEPGPVRVIKFD